MPVPPNLAGTIRSSPLPPGDHQSLTSPPNNTAYPHSTKVFRSGLKLPRKEVQYSNMSIPLRVDITSATAVPALQRPLDHEHCFQPRCMRTTRPGTTLLSQRSLIHQHASVSSPSYTTQSSRAYQKPLYKTRLRLLKTLPHQNHSVSSIVTAYPSGTEESLQNLFRLSQRPLLWHPSVSLHA